MPQKRYCGLFSWPHCTHRTVMATGITILIQMRIRHDPLVFGLPANPVSIEATAFRVLCGFSLRPFAVKGSELAWDRPRTLLRKGRRECRIATPADLG